MKILQHLILACIAFQATAQTPSLVKDINSGASDGFPDYKEHPVAIGSVVYFSGADSVAENKAWYKIYFHDSIIKY